MGQRPVGFVFIELNDRGDTYLQELVFANKPVQIEFHIKHE